ncbi:hypothetical protein ACF07L_29200 [Streptomyces anulatus]|uniref:hypothetical protein n=1 Tax=Streptomyces anulatus TaxID=1892 RepID=UPI0036F5AD7A
MGDLRDEDGYLSNEISGGNFYGPVNQFRDVHGNVNFNWAQPARSPEEVAFREQYMAEMRRQWAEQRAQRAGDKAAKGCGCVGTLAVIIGIAVFYSVSGDGISTFFLSLLAIPFIGGLLKAFK